MTPQSLPSLPPAPLWADGRAKPGGVHSSCSSRASVTSARPFGPKGRAEPRPPSRPDPSDRSRRIASECSRRQRPAPMPQCTKLRPVRFISSDIPNGPWCFGPHPHSVPGRGGPDCQPPATDRRPDRVRERTAEVVGFSATSTPAREPAGTWSAARASSAYRGAPMTGSSRDTGSRGTSTACTRVTASAFRSRRPDR